MSQEAGGSTCDHTLYRLMRPRSRDGQFEAFKVCARAVWASTSVAQLRAVLSMYELSTYNSRSGRYEADMPKSLFPQLPQISSPMVTSRATLKVLQVGNRTCAPTTQTRPPGHPSVQWGTPGEVVVAVTVTRRRSLNFGAKVVLVSSYASPADHAPPHRGPSHVLVL